MKPWGGRYLRWLTWAAVILFALFNLELAGGQTCSHCLSDRSWKELRLGIWGASIPVWPRMHSEVAPSQYARDFDLAEHEHHWRGGGHTARMFFGLLDVGYACGGMDRGWASMAYENDASFRKLVTRKMERGELSRQDLDALVLGDANKQTPELRALQDGLMDELVEMP